MAYIETDLTKGFIQGSVSSATAPILFAKNTHGGLGFLVEYQELNLAKVQNRNPIPQISERLDRMCVARIFTTLDLPNT
jgi:hypothetical protein